MRPPISLVYGNLVFGADLDDGWAAFAVPTSSYEWLSEDGKRERFLALLGALEVLAADIQIVRVSRRWGVGAYAEEMAGVPDAAGGSGGWVGKPGGPGEQARRSHARALTRYVAAHVQRLEELDAQRPAVFLLVSLRDPERDVASYVSRAVERHPREWLAGLRRGLLPRDRRLLRAAELERARVRADQAHARLADYLDARPATGAELQWLVRRAFCRELGEPRVDGLHEPRALVFERNGEAVLAPLEGDVLRWADGWVEHRARALRIESELGVCWQAQLVVGALPERGALPGGARGADVRARREPPVRRGSLAQRPLPAQRAGAADRTAADPGRRPDPARGVRRRAGGHRPRLPAHPGGARPARPPAVLQPPAAAARDARDRASPRARRTSWRSAWRCAAARTGRSACTARSGDQLQLFCQHLPGQRTRVAGYDDTLTAEQVRGDDADRHARGGLAPAASTSATR